MQAASESLLRFLERLTWILWEAPSAKTVLRTIEATTVLTQGQCKIVIVTSPTGETMSAGRRMITRIWANHCYVFLSVYQTQTEIGQTMLQIKIELNDK